MSKLRLEVTTVVEPDVEVLPELTVEQQQKLLNEIVIYEEMVEAASDAAADLDAQKTYITTLQKQMGGGAPVVSPGEGYRLTIVGGDSSSLDKAGLMKRFKITPAQWAEFVKKTPKKKHLRITTPKTTAAEAKAKAAKASRDERDEEDDRE